MQFTYNEINDIKHHLNRQFEKTKHNVEEATSFLKLLDKVEKMRVKIAEKENIDLSDDDIPF